MNILRLLEADIINQHRLYESAYKLSWSFLYTKAETLRPDQKLIFVGLNPGWAERDVAYVPVLENEKGYNSYLDEDWGEGAGCSRLQRQVQSLFKGVAQKTGRDYRHLMAETMAANYVPFRSASWYSLERRGEALKFAEGLWRKIIPYTNPDIVVCMSHLPYRGFEKIFDVQAHTVKKPTGWGKITYSVSRFDWNGKPRLLVRLPHLSRFPIFDKDHLKYKECTEDVTAIIAHYYQR